jgi:hypothetical protein
MMARVLADPKLKKGPATCTVPCPRLKTGLEDMHVPDPMLETGMGPGSHPRS